MKKNSTSELIYLKKIKFAPSYILEAVYYLLLVCFKIKDDK